MRALNGGGCALRARGQRGDAQAAQRWSRFAAPAAAAPHASLAALRAVRRVAPPSPPARAGALPVAHRRLVATPRAAVAAVAAAAALPPPPARVLLAGVTSGFGLQLISLFASQGSHVTVLCRSAASEAPLRAAGASAVVVGDATDDDVARAAVAAAAPALLLSAVGTSPPAPCPGAAGDANSRATAALATALGAHSPSARFVLVSALGVGDSLDCLPHPTHDVLRPWLDRKQAAEDCLTASGLEWTVLRPGPLTDDPPSGAAVVTLDATSGKAFSTLSRADLAQVAYQACVSPAACRRVLTVLNGGAVIIAAPFLRELEAWEAAPFAEFKL